MNSIVLSAMSEAGPYFGSLEEHENAAIEAMEKSIDMAVKAYLHLAIIWKGDLWKEAINSDGEKVSGWQEYLGVFSEKLSDSVRGGASKSTFDQRLRDYARYHLWAGADPEVSLSLSPSAANELIKIGEWAPRGSEEVEEGSLIRWNDGVRENVLAYLGKEDEEVDDKVLVRELVETVHAIPEVAKHELKNRILRKPSQQHLFEWKAVRVNGSGARAFVIWELVEEDGSVVKTWQGNPQAPGAPIEVVYEYAKKLGVMVIHENGE